MVDVSELIKAISTLLWPIFAFCALFCFKKEIAEMIVRIKKGKLLGQEFEMSESLNQLRVSAVTLSAGVASIANPAKFVSITEEDVEDIAILKSQLAITTIIQEAERSPKAALRLLASELEKEAIQIIAVIGKLEGRKHVTITKAVADLDSYYGGLPEYVSSSLLHFWNIRNKLIHGENADDSSILSAIDSGIIILKALQSLPKETNWVHNPGVEIYSDSECKNPIPNIKGLILKTVSPSGTKTKYQIFPTTINSYIKGKRVGSEWNFQNVWNSAWYIDPETNEVRQAWISSAEFTGRHLDEL